MHVHKYISKHLVGFALGDPPADMRAQVEAHLSQCPVCAHELRRLRSLLQGTECIRGTSVTQDAVATAEQAVLDAVGNLPSKQTQPGQWFRLDSARRTTMNKRMMKLTAAAALVLVVLGGVRFWPDNTPGRGAWWLGPPAVWAQEIMAQMEEVEALVLREQAVFTGQHGFTHVSGSWSRVYQASDRLRRDAYYEPTDESTFGPNSPDSVLVEVIWELPEGNDLKVYKVSHEFKCYKIFTKKDEAYRRNPLDEVRFYMGLLDRADRLLETKVFDEHECVGFEIDTSKYGDNPQGRTDRIWFDVETKLPVRIEKHGRPVTHSGYTRTEVLDQFEYDAQVPAETFVPKIPDGFINADPREMREARGRKNKGNLIQADTPAGLRDEVVAALKQVKTASFQKRFGFVHEGNWVFSSPSKISISPNGWREDKFSGEQVCETNYYVSDIKDWSKPRFDLKDPNGTLTQTHVNFDKRTYSVTKRDRAFHSGNAMDRIIFIAGMLDRADRFWEKKVINGIECFGFELSAKKYGTNPDTHKHRMWFDIQTKLPVKTEFEWVQTEGPRLDIRETFQWNPAFPAETFTPTIPEDYTAQ